MRAVSLLVIVAIFGAIIVFAAAILFSSPAFITLAGSGAPAGTSVKYVPAPSLPPPRYYTGIDFPTLRSDANLTVIPLRSFRQQVTNYTAGPAAAMTVLSYYGMAPENTDAEEARVAREMNTSQTTGTNPEQLSTWLAAQGMNATWGTGGTREMLLGNLRNGTPTIVEWIDWGGFWVVVVGYDTRGTENPWDDVIIFADSVDCHDDLADGVTYFNYWRFDAMWFDAQYFPEDMRDRPWVVAVPAGTPLPG